MWYDLAQENEDQDIWSDMIYDDKGNDSKFVSVIDRIVMHKI